MVIPSTIAAEPEFVRDMLEKHVYVSLEYEQGLEIAELATI